MSLEEVMLSYVGGNWQNLPFLGRTRTLVPASKVGTGTHCVERKWYQYQKKGYRYPFTSRGLVQEMIKVVPVPMLPATLFLYPLYY